jgi:L-alanine-DL-glutamate epimerase and related enzymes of enolase superfamily
MSMRDRIASVEVHLVETPVKGNFADSTRKVETIGFVVVLVKTDTGRTGLGITYHEVGGEAIRECINVDIAPRILGRSPMETEALYDESFAYMRGIGRKGLAFCAYSAIDIALWDLKGQMHDLPLFRLLGGKRNVVPVYASGGWTSYSIDELVEEAKRMVSEGYTKMKLKIGVDGGKNINEDVRRIRAVREAVGPEVDIMLDANNAWTAATAIRFADKVRELDIFLLEEPVFADDIPGLARFKRGSNIPVGTGEHEYTRFGVRDLILGNAVDIVQADVARCGGYTESLKIIALIQAWNLQYAPHGMEHMHMHLVAAHSCGLMLERLYMFEQVVGDVFDNPPAPKNGMLTLPETPGLGLKVKLDALKSLKMK